MIYCSTSIDPMERQKLVFDELIDQRLSQVCEFIDKIRYQFHILRAFK